MEQTRTNDFLGTEKIGKLLRKFAIPCVVALLISALYNIVDQIFIGNSYLGEQGNAATGVVFPITILALAIATCFGDGCAAALSICQGKKDTDRAHKSIGTGLVVSLLISVILAIVLILLDEPILSLFGASSEFMEYAKEYLRIIAWFIPVYVIGNFINPIIRSDGSPIYSMICIGSGAVINIILDPIFINKWGLGLGMAGAAWATIIGQCATLLLSLFYFLFKTKTFKLKLKSLIIDFRSLQEISLLGVSTFVTQFSIVVISLVCNIMLKKYGALSSVGATIPIAVIAVESKVFTVFLNIVVGIALGAQPICGYNLGAGKLDRVKKTYRLVILCSLVISLTFTLVNEIAPQIFIIPFGNTGDAQYMAFAKRTFRLFLSTMTLTCLIKATAIFFQSIGQPKFALATSLTRDIIIFVPVCCILPLCFSGADNKLYSILYTPIIADGVGFILTVVLVSVCLYKLTQYQHNLVKDNEFNKKFKFTYPSHKGIIVAISREHGSRGREIAQCLAKQMHVPYYDKSIIKQLAKNSGITSKYATINTVVANQYSKYFDIAEETACEEIVLRLSKMGSFVIVGLGADYLLRENKNLVSIFLYADEETKIKNIMNSYGDSRKDAIVNMKKYSDNRASIYNTITNRGYWGHRSNYDLSINTSIGEKETQRVLIAYLLQITKGSLIRKDHKALSKA